MRSSVRSMLCATLFVVPLAVACQDPAPAPQQEEPAPAKPAPTAPGAPSAAPSAPTTAKEAGTPAAEAEKIFAQRCVTCHGATGAGDGPAAAALNPKPRAFGSADWQKSVTDEHIEKIIREGGAAVGLSPLMPGNPDLADKPELIKALREYVRSFGKK